MRQGESVPGTETSTAKAFGNLHSCELNCHIEFELDAKIKG